MPYNSGVAPVLPMQPTAAVDVTSGYPFVTKIGGDGFSESDLKVCFPKDYFVGIQSYLRMMGQQIPPQANPTEQVYWALDAWFHINAALYALNIPFAGVSGLHGYFGGEPSGISDEYQPIRPVAILESFYKAIDDFYLNVESRRKDELQRIKRGFANPFYVESAEKAKTYPAPFMSLMPMWTGTVGRNNNYTNPIGKRIEKGFLPWMTNGLVPPDSSKWTDKSAADRTTARSNPAFALALSRWRWWCLRDDYPWNKIDESLFQRSTPGWVAPNKKRVPFGMGSVDSMASLGAYINKVKSEADKADVYFDGGSIWYPSLDYTCSAGLKRMIDIITTIQYDKTVRDHVGVWMTKSQPEMDASGNVKTFTVMGEVRKAATPVTREDFDDIVKDRQRELQARLNKAITDPMQYCKDSSTTESARKACEKANALYKQANEIPIWKQINQGMQKLMLALVKLLGAAEGWSYVPFTLMNAPFSRSVRIPAYSTVISGGSKDVLQRMINAISAIQETLKIHIAPWLPPQWVAAIPAGTVKLDSEGNPIYAVTVPPRQLSPAEQTEACNRLIDIYVSTNQITITAAERAEAHRMCLAEAFGKTLPAGSLEKYLDGRAPPPVLVPITTKPPVTPKKLVLVVGGTAAALGLLSLVLRRGP